jgi:fluoride ion exporter CrcB/FEX
VTLLAVAVAGLASTVSVEVFYDAHTGDSGFAVLYLAVSIAGGLIGAAAGYYAGRALAH